MVNTFFFGYCTWPQVKTKAPKHTGKGLKTAVETKEKPIDVSRLDLRVGRILSVKPHENAGAYRFFMTAFLTLVIII